MHEDLTRAINDMIKGPKNIHVVSIWNYLSTFNRQEHIWPKNYCPNTCLPTVYKIIKAALTYRILLRNSILPDKQKCWCSMWRWCVDQLLVSRMIISLVKKRQRHLCVAGIDYRKECDGLPNTWIFTLMDVYQICPTIRWSVEAPRKEWKTEMWLYHTKRHVKRESGY